MRGEFVIDGSVLNATRVAVSSRVSKKKKKVHDGICHDLTSTLDKAVIVSALCLSCHDKCRSVGEGGSSVVSLGFKTV